MNRLLFFLHRWLGVGLAVFMLLWFLSGLVIVYSSYMYQNRAMQLAHAEPLRLESGWLGFGAAWAQSAGERAARDANAEARSGRGRAARNNREGAEGRRSERQGGEQSAETAIVEARLLRQGGEPVWLAEDARGRQYALSAVDGHLWQVSADDALKIAVGWLERENRAEAASSLQYRESVEKPAILRGQEALSPFHRVALQDGWGGELLISATSGEVVHVSNRLERASYWVGNWLHMFRFLDLAGWGEARTDVLFWAITLSLLASLTGLIVGWLRWRPGWFGKPTYNQGRTQPYRLFWFRWHFWAGLIGGIVATLWALSGVLSSLQSSLFSPATPNREAVQQYYGVGIPAALRDWQPALSISEAAEVVQLGWRRLGDEAVLLAHKADGERILVESSPLSEDALNAAVARLTQTDANVEKTVDVLHEYDAYYYPRHRRGAYDRPLPAWRFQLADSAGTHVYLDPLDGRLLLRDDRSRRQYRWLFSALHHWDLPVLYQRPLWDVWMLAWIALGLVLSVSSVVLGVKRLRVTLRRREAKAERKPKAAPAAVPPQEEAPTPVLAIEETHP
ncbi:MAG: PepSY domain-containing protein [Zoogloeaceae bacterium]|nr:PepSY domain-containing protein [Zoogloeaceae bacterium]